MEVNARKYCLDVCEIMSYGISACTSCYQCSVLESFTVNIDGTTCNYSQITTEQVALLSTPDYEKRVGDYLVHLNIEDSTLKTHLITGSTYYDPDCDVLCGLNSEFLVYRFLTGVRVVNVGEGNGEIQYKAYQLGENPEDYSWQTSGTFLDLNLSYTYVFEVRDVIEGEEFCKVQRTVSLSTLVQSTTFTPNEKLVYINQVTCSSSGYAYYNIGTVGICPTLVNDERVSVGFLLCADASGDATSCAQLFCKPNGSSTYTSYRCITEDEGDTTNIFTLCAGDSMCYNLTTVVPTAGSCGCACFKITSVNGGGTTVPSIDVSRCCESRSACIPRTNLVVTATGTTTYPSSSCVKNTGNFVFTPAIPQGNCVTMNLAGQATISPVAVGASASVIIKCKPNGGAFFDTIRSYSQNSPQPISTQVIARYGDCLCYEVNVNSVAGTTSTACFSVVDTFDSFGINSSIGSPSGACVTKTVTATPVTVALCCQNFNGGTGFGCEDGYITITPALSGSQCVRINYSSELFVSYFGPALVDLFACMKIYCKKAGNAYYTTIASCTTNVAPGDLFAGIIMACAGDSLCYCIKANVDRPAEASAALSLDNALGANGVTASICSTATKNFRCVIGSL